MTWDAYPFDPEPWGITRVGLNQELVGLDETLFTLSNGNLGVRASFEQGGPHHEPGTLLNGFHETWPIVYPEPAYGFATVGQTILFLPDANHLRIVFDGKVLDLRNAHLSRHLNFRTGTLTTSARWPELTATWERMVSHRRPEVHATRLTLGIAQDGRLEVDARVVNRVDLERSGQDVQLLEPGEEVDPRQAPDFGRRVLAPGTQAVASAACALGYRTVSSGLPMTVAARLVSSDVETVWEIPDPDRAISYSTIDVEPGREVQFQLTATYRRDDDVFAALEEIASLPDFDVLSAELESDLDDLWATSDIEIEGDPIAQQAVRFSIFHLHQASNSNRGLSIAARGLTGRTYEGHFFWDSSAFVVPFLSATNPAAAREEIGWRHSVLPKARERARAMSLDGALYPWRTINGEEASAFFEAGTAQYHVNADVVHSIRTYLAWTGDDELLWEWGVEIAVETARMWASLGFWAEDGFHIHKVTGPDEYTALVNDNAYTNQMARMNLRFAVEVTERMENEQPSRYADLAERLSLGTEEAARWEEIADGLVIVHDTEREITAQDSTFLSLEPWDWSTPRDRYPLLLHFHPLVIYRHQLLKQADVIMAHYLLPEDTALDQQRRDFDFYDPITTGDSSLSPAIQSAVATRVGRHHLAWGYFEQAALTDLDNTAGNGAGGLHLACAAGVWLAVVHGFADVATGGEDPRNPHLPPGWESLTIKCMIRGEGRQIRVDADGQVTSNTPPSTN